METCQWSVKCKLWCRKWNDLLKKVLKSTLCDYNDAYILGRGDITVTAAPATKIYGITIDDAEDLVIPMSI